MTDESIDVEEYLREMKELSELKARTEAKYKELRDKVTPLVTDRRYFMSAAGQKLYAFRVQQTKLIVDEDYLREHLPADVFAEITKTVLDDDAYKQAVATGRVPVAVFKAATKQVPKGAPHLRFGDPEAPERE